jgi:hypothetical protein
MRYAMRYAMQKLMIVSWTFFHRARGMLELQPKFSAMGVPVQWPGWRTLPPDALQEGVAEMRRPDGSKFEAAHRIGVAHFIWENRLENPAWVHSVMLKDCDQADVPTGSEVWIDLPYNN